MDTPMLLELQFAKTIEYLLAVGFLLLFIPFWRYVSPLAARRAMVAAQKPVESEAAWAPATLEPALAFAGRAGVAEPTGWFSVPDGIRIHPGHAWVKSIDRGEVVAGVDDFTRAVVGPIDDVDMPAVGSMLRQGEPAWTLQGAAGPVPILSPVDGMVVATNPAARLGAIDRDPYGEGWLVRVQAPRFRSNAKQLLNGSAARAWMEDVSSRLRAAIAPDLGPALADGGVPVQGIARDVGPEAWGRIAHEFFMLEGPAQESTAGDGASKA